MINLLKSQTFNIVLQTLPFLMITGLFVGIAYTCGGSLSQIAFNDSATLIKYSCFYLP